MSDIIKRSWAERAQRESDYAAGKLPDRRNVVQPDARLVCQLAASVERQATLRMLRDHLKFESLDASERVLTRYYISVIEKGCHNG